MRKEQLRELVADKFLVKEGALYKSAAVYKGGRVILNGRGMSLAELLLMK
jgi:hypothetical protein